MPRICALLSLATLGAKAGSPAGLGLVLWIHVHRAFLLFVFEYMSLKLSGHIIKIHNWFISPQQEQEGKGIVSKLDMFESI